MLARQRPRCIGARERQNATRTDRALDSRHVCTRAARTVGHAGTASGARVPAALHRARRRAGDDAAAVRLADLLGADERERRLARPARRRDRHRPRCRHAAPRPLRRGAGGPLQPSAAADRYAVCGDPGEPVDRARDVGEPGERPWAHDLLRAHLRHGRALRDRRADTSGAGAGPAGAAADTGRHLTGRRRDADSDAGLAVRGGIPRCRVRFRGRLRLRRDRERQNRVVPTAFPAPASG